jgi:hypothetical protein
LKIKHPLNATGVGVRFALVLIAEKSRAVQRDIGKPAEGWEGVREARGSRVQGVTRYIGTEKRVKIYTRWTPV